MTEKEWDVLEDFETILSVRSIFSDFVCYQLLSKLTDSSHRPAGHVH